MGSKVYVGNLPWSVRNDGLKDMFAEYGEVVEARVITDKFTKRSKGFGFVTFANDSEAAAAINATNGKEVEGRALKVSEAKEMEPRN